MFKFGRGFKNFGLEYIRIFGAPRIVNVNWTAEMADEIQAFHNIDAEAELTALLSEQLAGEIDRDILFRIRYDITDLRMIKKSTFKFGR